MAHEPARIVRRMNKDGRRKAIHRTQLSAFQQIDFSWQSGYRSLPESGFALGGCARNRNRNPPCE
jgi:hypothetical protein